MALFIVTKLSPVVPNLWFGPPPNGDNINHRGHEINGARKTKKLNYATHICFHIWDVFLIFTLLCNFISLGLKLVVT